MLIYYLKNKKALKISALVLLIVNGIFNLFAIIFLGIASKYVPVQKYNSVQSFDYFTLNNYFSTFSTLITLSIFAVVAWFLVKYINKPEKSKETLK